MILSGIGLHAGIAVLVNIPIFGELTTAAYLTFLTAGELDAFLARIDPRSWFRRRRALSRPTPVQSDSPRPRQGVAGVPAPHWHEELPSGYRDPADADDVDAEIAGV
jgi:hypothetical protein